MPRARASVDGEDRQHGEVDQPHRAEMPFVEQRIQRRVVAERDLAGDVPPREEGYGERRGGPEHRLGPWLGTSPASAAFTCSAPARSPPPIAVARRGTRTHRSGCREPASRRCPRTTHRPRVRRRVATTATVAALNPSNAPQPCRAAVFEQKRREEHEQHVHRQDVEQRRVVREKQRRHECRMRLFDVERCEIGDCVRAMRELRTARAPRTAAAAAHLRGVDFRASGAISRGASR